MSPILLGLAEAAIRAAYAQGGDHAHDNIASQKVLAKNRFVPIGPAELSGKPGTWYERDLSAG